MDWKKAAADDLRRYPALIAAVENITDRQETLNNRLYSARTGTLSAAPTHGGGSRYEDAILNATVEKDRLAYNKNDVKRELRRIERGLDVLSDDERRVLERFYIRRTKGFIDDLCVEFYCEKSEIYRRKDEALKRFTLALYGIIEG